MRGLWKLKGCLHLNYKDERSKEQYYAYTELIENKSQEERNRLFKTWHPLLKRKEISLTCTCNFIKKIDMTISYSEDTGNYHLRTFSNQKEWHVEGCNYFGGSYTSGNGYSSNWREDEHKNIHINLNPSHYKNKKIRQNVSSSNSCDSGSSAGTPGVTQNKLSIYELIRKILTKSWDDYIFFNVFKGTYPYPDLKIIYKQVIEKTSKKLFISNSLTLNDIMYKKGKPGSIYFVERANQFKYHVFYLLEYIRHEQKVNGISMVYARNPLDNTEIEFTVESEAINKAFDSIRVNQGPYIIGGFIKSIGSGKPPQIISTAIVPINSKGVVIESSYERYLYDQICRERRLVQRIYDTKYHPKWNGIKPDGLFIDTQPPTVIEVFGMSESQVGYHEDRRIKIEHFSNLKAAYDFWYWDAFKTNIIPEFPVHQNRK